LTTIFDAGRGCSGKMAWQVPRLPEILFLFSVFLGALRASVVLPFPSLAYASGCYCRPR
jgi:hypothetical protein